MQNCRLASSQICNYSRTAPLPSVYVSSNLGELELIAVSRLEYYGIWENTFPIDILRKHIPDWHFEKTHFNLRLVRHKHQSGDTQHMGKTYYHATGRDTLKHVLEASEILSHLQTCPRKISILKFWKWIEGMLGNYVTHEKVLLLDQAGSIWSGDAHKLSAKSAKSSRICHWMDRSMTPHFPIRRKSQGQFLG